MNEVYRKNIPMVSPEFRVTNASGKSRVLREGGIVRETAVAIYDVSGGDSGAIGTFNTGVFLPNDAIITRVFIDVITTFTTAGADAGTLAIQIQTADDVVAAIAVSNATNVWDAGIRGSKIGYPNFGADAAHDTAVEVAALFAGSMLKLTAQRQVALVVGGQVVTAGKLAIYIDFYVGA